MKRILNIFFVFLCSYAFAGGNYKLTDLHSGEELMYRTEYDNYKAEKLNFADEVDVEYPEFFLKDTVLRKKIKLQLGKMIKDGLLNGEVLGVMEKFDFVEQRKSRRSSRYRRTKLKDVDYHIVSYIDNVVLIVFSYSFQTSQYSSRRRAWKKYVYIDLKTGKFFNQKDVFVKSAIATLGKKVKSEIDKFRKQKVESIEENIYEGQDYDEVEEEEPRYNRYNRSKSYQSKQNKSNKKFDFLNDGYAYFAGFSIAYSLYDLDRVFTKPNKAVTIRLAWDEYKRFLNPYGPYGRIKNKQFVSSTNYSNVSIAGNSLHQFHHVDIPIVDPRKAKVGGNIKSITLSQYKVNKKHGNDDFLQPDTVLKVLESLEYDNLGRISSIKDKACDANTVQFTYNKKGLIAKRSNFKNYVLNETAEYTYDASGNLLKVIVTYKNHMPTIDYYFYNGKSVICESYGRGSASTNKFVLDKHGDISHTISPISRGYSNSNSVVRKSEDGRILAKYKEENGYRSEYYTLYSYDAEKKLVSKEMKEYYETYSYNQQGALVGIKKIRYSSRALTSNTQFAYNNKNHVVEVKEVRTNYTRRNKRYKIEYTYWE